MTTKGEGLVEAGGWCGGFKDGQGRRVGRHVCSVHSAPLLAPATHSANGYYLVIFMALNLKEIGGNAHFL